MRGRLWRRRLVKLLLLRLVLLRLLRLLVLRRGMRGRRALRLSLELLQPLPR